MAQKWGLPTATREESMGICFVGEKRKFDDFICEDVSLSFPSNKAKCWRT